MKLLASAEQLCMRTPLIKLWNFLKRIFKKTYVRCLERTEVFWIATCSSRWVFATQITAFITYVTTNLKKEEKTREKIQKKKIIKKHIKSIVTMSKAVHRAESW